MNKRTAAAALTAYILIKQRQRRRGKRTLWVKTWLQTDKEKNNTICNLMGQLCNEDTQYYKNFLRLNAEDFDYLVEKLRPLIEKKDTIMRKVISTEMQLALILWYLATGDSYHSLMYLFWISVPSISLIIPETVKSIYLVLKDDYLKIPQSRSDWEQIAADFLTMWQFPNCLGSVDGKHIDIKCPSNSGSNYYNYKGQFSIVLMGIADANYRLIYANIRAPGQFSDGGVFSDCSFTQALKNGNLNIPEPIPLPGRTTLVLYCLIGDDAFALDNNLLKPYSLKKLDISQRIFNYRLCRACQIIENVFEIMGARFRILRKTIELDPKRVTSIVLAVCALHNFLVTRHENNYAPRGTFDSENEDGTITFGSWQTEEIELTPLQNVPQRNGDNIKSICEEFKNYFNCEGHVSWQLNFI